MVTSENAWSSATLSSKRQTSPIITYSPLKLEVKVFPTTTACSIHSLLPSISGGFYFHSRTADSTFHIGHGPTASRHPTPDCRYCYKQQDVTDLKMLWFLLVVFIALPTYSSTYILIVPALVRPTLRYCRQFVIPCLQTKLCIYDILVNKEIL
jgi:hypothetical protein